jgi:two-component system, OmpR family, phosphate regulon sensor histidine kinase PhoR
MPLITFLLGLAVGIGLVFWQQVSLHQQLQQLLDELQVGSLKDGLSLWSQLRRKLLQSQQDRHRLEETLQTWQQILQVAPIAYLQVDEENQLHWCNQQALLLLKIENWDAREPLLLLKLVRSYELDRTIEQARESQQPKIKEWIFHWSNEDLNQPEREQSVTVVAHAFPLINGHVGVFLENRQPLLDLAQSRDLWLSDLTHELKTPLTSIQLVAEALVSRVEPPLHTWVERLLREVQRLIHLVEDWLELSRIATETDRKLTCQRLELGSLIQSVWHTLEPLAQAKHVRLRTLIDDRLCLEADESRLFRVFLNLLDNAIRYTPPEGEIRIEAWPKVGDRIQIEIIDSGSGFATHDLPHVFDRLYRGDPSRQRDAIAGSTQSISNGSGLGLAIVREIIIAHGGSITAKNYTDTGGGWIEIDLPVASR